MVKAVSKMCREFNIKGKDNDPATKPSGKDDRNFCHLVVSEVRRSVLFQVFPWHTSLRCKCICTVPVLLRPSKRNSKRTKSD